MSGIPTRRVGRPRLRPADSGALDPREEILAAAAALFSAHGYSATSTRQIAELVGVRQASLFHHFERKEDILAELLDRTLRPALAFSAWLEATDVAPAVALYALSRFDSRNLCSSPNNLAGLQLLPEARDERFAAFWKDRAALRAAYGRCVAEIVLDGGRLVDAELTGDLVFGLVESVLTWFDRYRSTVPDVVAAATADAVLRIVGVPGGQCRRVARQGTEVLGAYAGPP